MMYWSANSADAVMSVTWPVVSRKVAIERYMSGNATASTAAKTRIGSPIQTMRCRRRRNTARYSLKVGLPSVAMKLRPPLEAMWFPGDAEEEPVRLGVLRLIFGAAPNVLVPAAESELPRHAP